MNFEQNLCLTFFYFDLYCLPMQKYVCGIDFGTTNSVIGVATPQEVCLTPVENESTVIPSALFYTPTDILLGRKAIESYIDGSEGRFMRSIKRILGTDLMDKYTVINKVPLKFDTIIAHFLAHLKTCAEHKTKSDITSVVLGRPVHYQDGGQTDNEAQEKMRQIAKAIGFKEILFQYEPIAAAFAHEQHLNQDKLALVVDLGGGTSDFTLIRIGPSYRSKAQRNQDILATFGIRIGGNDFDRDLSLACFMPSFGRNTTYGPKNLNMPGVIYSNLSEWSKINFTYTPQNIDMVQELLLSAHDKPKVERLLELLEHQKAHYLLNTVEETKINLTTQEHLTPTFNALHIPLTFDVSRLEFEKIVLGEIEKINAALHEVLAQASLRPNQVELLILTGGTCEIPLVARTLRAAFPQAQMTDTQKMASVGLGLTYHAQKCLL